MKETNNADRKLGEVTHAAALVPTRPSAVSASRIAGCGGAAVDFPIR